VDIRVEDVTQNMDDVASRWRAARELHRAELDRIEGAAESAVFQRFLDAAAVLARERRLSRLAFVAAKP
jgi:hypothetical protein